MLQVSSQFTQAYTLTYEGDSIDLRDTYATVELYVEKLTNRA